MARTSILDTTEHKKLIGVIPDRKVADLIKCSSELIRKYRIKNSIPARWRGEKTDEEIRAENKKKLDDLAAAAVVKRPSRKAKAEKSVNVISLKPKGTNGGGAPIQEPSKVEEILEVLATVHTDELAEAVDDVMDDDHDPYAIISQILAGTLKGRHEGLTDLESQVLQLKQDYQGTEKALLERLTERTPVEDYVLRFSQLTQAGVPTPDAVRLATTLGDLKKPDPDVMMKVSVLENAVEQMGWKVNRNEGALEPLKAQLRKTVQDLEHVGERARAADEKAMRVCDQIALLKKNLN